MDIFKEGQPDKKLAEKKFSSIDRNFFFGPRALFRTRFRMSSLIFRPLSLGWKVQFRNDIETVEEREGERVE